MSNEPTKNIEKSRNTDKQLNYYEQLNQFIASSGETPLEQMLSFATYTSRQAITKFLEHYELYKVIKNTPGRFVECGVGSGQGIMSFAHFCSIFEPYHYVRKLVGFDTFEGFQGITEKDLTSKAEHLKPGGLCFDTHEKMLKTSTLFDENRALGNVPKLEFVRGDISETFPVYLEKNPSLVIAMLYLDLDLYKPTKDTIKHALKRIPKGGMIVFDELNHADYPGETIAVMEELGIHNLRLRRLEFSSMVSYAIVGE